MVRKLQEEHYDHQSTASGSHGQVRRLSSNNIGSFASEEQKRCAFDQDVPVNKTGDIPHEIQLSKVERLGMTGLIEDETTVMRENDKKMTETTRSCLKSLQAPEGATTSPPVIVSAGNCICQNIPSAGWNSTEDGETVKITIVIEEAFDNRRHWSALEATTDPDAMPKNSNHPVSANGAGAAQ
jgi:hypothetical protein